MKVPVLLAVEDLGWAPRGKRSRKGRSQRSGLSRGWDPGWSPGGVNRGTGMPCERLGRARCGAQAGWFQSGVRANGARGGGSGVLAADGGLVLLFPLVRPSLFRSAALCPDSLLARSVVYSLRSLVISREPFQDLNPIREAQPVQSLSLELPETIADDGAFLSNFRAGLGVTQNSDLTSETQDSFLVRRTGCQNRSDGIRPLRLSPGIPVDAGMRERAPLTFLGRQGRPPLPCQELLARGR